MLFHYFFTEKRTKILKICQLTAQFSQKTAKKLSNSKLKATYRLSDTKEVRRKRKRWMHLSTSTFLGIMTFRRLTNHDRLVLRNQCLHDSPCNQISNITDAEYNHITGLLAFKSHEGEGFAHTLRVGEQCTGTLVDKE